jgi:hypothetical protein
MQVRTFYCGKTGKPRQVNPIPDQHTIQTLSCAVLDVLLNRLWLAAALETEAPNEDPAFEGFEAFRACAEKGEVWEGPKF